MQALKNCALFTLFLISSAFVSANTGTTKVGTDNLGNDVIMGWRTKGDNDGRPVIVFADPYLGIASWQKVQNKFSDDYFTIAYDNLGYGTSSKNTPTALDGINNLPGYSYRQQAYFLHQLLIALDPKGPITFVPVDTQGQVGTWYTVDYANTQYPFTKLFFETVNISPTVAYDNDPCTLAFVPYSTMQQIVAFYAAAPTLAITAILGTSFKTAQCPSVAQDILNLCLPYATSVPADVFARIALDTYREDLEPLMSNPVFANVPVSNIYGTSADSVPMSRRGVLSSFIGNAPGYPNPSFQGACVTPLPSYISGFPISYVLTYPGHGTIVHLTAYKKFVSDLEDFITDAVSKCSIKLPN